jgi:hypothetical protein
MERGNVGDKALGMNSEGDSAKAMRGLMQEGRRCPAPPPAPHGPPGPVAGCYPPLAVLARPFGALASCGLCSTQSFIYPQAVPLIAEVGHRNCSGRGSAEWSTVQQK